MSEKKDDIYFMKATTSQHAHKKKKTCINCWRSEPDIEFYEEIKGYEWQHTLRCKLCERKYQQDFLELYPDTKPDHKLKPLTKKELDFYNKMMIEERDFNNE